MKDFTVSVPCKRYIRKYYTHIYGPQIPLSHDTDFGDTILTKISMKPIIRMSRQFLNVAFNGYNEQITFRLPVSLFYYVETNLNHQNIYNINRFLQNTFESDFFHIVQIAAAFGVERRKAMEVFIKKHGIEIDNDITLDALLQMEYRCRTKTSISNKFLVHLSSTLRNP